MLAPSCPPDQSADGSPWGMHAIRLVPGIRQEAAPSHVSPWDSSVVGPSLILVWSPVLGREEREGRRAVGPERTSEASQSPGDASNRVPRGSPRRAPYGRYIPGLEGTALSAGTDSGSSLIGLSSPDSLKHKAVHSPQGCSLVHSSFFRPGLPGVLQHLHASPHGILATQGVGVICPFYRSGN